MKKNTKSMPKVVIAKSAGFCFGVRRAITLAEKTAQNKKGIYTLGPLIHNPQEVKRLEKNGVKSIADPRRLKDATLIIRTHGIPAPLMEKLQRQKLTIVDATCPFVKRAQDIVKRLHSEGCQVVIVGERTHPEVVALVSYGGPSCSVVESTAGLRTIKLLDKVGIVSQTTQTPDNFTTVLGAIKKARPGVKVFNTICRATMDRQTEAKSLAKRMDVMVVVGGKNSGNTRRLAEICGAYTRTYPIETAMELKNAWFHGARKIGITAGASTPDWIIKKVKDTIISITEAER
jgi:4-hydroxy-3-methylbut-2-enyl diphosphate reductase